MTDDFVILKMLVWAVICEVTITKQIQLSETVLVFISAFPPSQCSVYLSICNHLH